jgi:hypothetical protein
MITIFAIVPNPGFSRRGIQRSSTNVLIAKVDIPIEISNLFATPWASTVHGALPVLLWTNNESPKPKINNPKKRIAVRGKDKSHRCLAAHEVWGIVR